MEFITTPVRQRKCRVAIPYAGEGGREIGEPMRDEMHDLAFALDAAVPAATLWPRRPKAWARSKPFAST
ncbi:protein of unknown function [Methylorubrum extorquens DM4]|uniref:Uncharacterized protein n=1 Tax=Methylorubrum extorquens (strain DSM 6343 / CIP 106787 / DM4) TaxID=661410 RepID=C7CAU8_METED|nr:hypothetical protein [Methylorubrum extorquens]CAX24231.1 protein of unknown function [Methylorubrum extorquens DM4]